jgi:DNA-binding MarR family transcriptional regulator
MSSSSEPPRFTDKQGQYLAFIYMYALVNGRPPAEADMQRFFEVTPPSVHNMVVQLERLGLIRRVPRPSRLRPAPPACTSRSRRSAASALARC